MDEANDSRVLVAFSDGLAAAAERAGLSTVTVSARRGYSASGIAWPGSGVIVTADHVLERDDNISVTVPSGEKVAAAVAGRDPGSDLAVLKVESPLTAAELSGVARVGQVVLALGRPEAAITASFGIVSAVGGPWQTMTGATVEGYLRSDATLYPGFSGGPLVDAMGRVLGVNSSRLGRGAGLSIPAAAADRIVQALIRQGRIRRGYLGISTQPVAIPEALAARLEDTPRSGLMLVGVEPGSPADAAGFIVGDILARFAGSAVADPRDLQARLGADSVGQAAEAIVLRGGARTSLKVTVGERG